MMPERVRHRRPNASVNQSPLPKQLYPPQDTTTTTTTTPSSSTQQEEQKQHFQKQSTTYFSSSSWKVLFRSMKRTCSLSKATKLKKILFVLIVTIVLIPIKNILFGHKSLHGTLRTCAWAHKSLVTLFPPSALCPAKR